jgi:L,D-transpeptidase ErfK/SrfK
MNTKRESKLMKLAAILAISAIDAYADERRTKGDRIVISIPDHKLVLLSGNSVLKIYDVAVGKPSTPSPRGEFTIISHVKNPTWYGPHIAVPPGKNNPLGTRWMGLSAKGYVIHGTNVPSSVGKSASHGCFRMRQDDLEELFEMVDVGVVVELRGERPQLLAQALAAPAAESLP